MSFGSTATNIYGLRADQLFEIQTAFHQFDLDHNGFITFDELRRCLRRSNVYHTDYDIQKVLTQMDFNHDGKVSYDEYMAFMARVYRGEIP